MPDVCELEIKKRKIKYAKNPKKPKNPKNKTKQKTKKKNLSVHFVLFF